MIGHVQSREELEKARPHGSLLFLGPQSVGKWTLARHLIRVWGVPDSDVIMCHKLSMDVARELSETLQFYPPSGDFRVIVIRYDGSTWPVLNVLLKTMEAASNVNHFILVGSALLPGTITSRCQVYRLSLLSTQEVEQILLDRRFSPTEAKRLAAASGGQVRDALNHADDSELRTTTLAAVRALTEHDPAALDALAARWTVENTAMLATLCHEVITKRWAMFASSEVEGFPKPMALKILTVLRADIRPRLTVRSSLMSVLRGE